MVSRGTGIHRQYCTRILLEINVFILYESASRLVGLLVGLPGHRTGVHIVTLVPNGLTSQARARRRLDDGRNVS